MNYFTPIQRLLIGFAAVILGAVGLVVGLIITLWFISIAGLIPTITVYVVLLLMVAGTMVYWQVKRLGAGWRSVVQYDPYAADEAGSTARYGTPHDHNFIPHRWKGRRPPPDPDMPDSFHRRPR